jgi:hypothetical protein
VYLEPEITRRAASRHDLRSPVELENESAVEAPL